MLKSNKMDELDLLLALGLPMYEANFSNERFMRSPEGIGLQGIMETPFDFVFSGNFGDDRR